MNTEFVNLILHFHQFIKVLFSNKLAIEIEINFADQVFMFGQ